MVFSRCKPNHYDESMDVMLLIGTLLCLIICYDFQLKNKLQIEIPIEKSQAEKRKKFISLMRLEFQKVKCIPIKTMSYILIKIYDKCCNIVLYYR